MEDIDLQDLNFIQERQNKNSIFIENQITNYLKHLEKNFGVCFTQQDIVRLRLILKI